MTAVAKNVVIHLETCRKYDVMMNKRNVHEQ